MPKFMTIADAQKMLDPKGRLARAVDNFTQANEILQVLPFTPCNGGGQHLVTVEDGLPDVYVKQVNKGVLPSTTHDTQFFEPTAMWESWEEFDIKVVPPGLTPSAIMGKKAPRHREAQAQRFAYEMFYGNALTDPDSIPGLSGRYSSLSGSNSQNIIDGGGTGGGCASIWLLRLGEDGLHGLYPEGAMAGLGEQDLGIIPKDHVGGVTDAKAMMALARFFFNAGIALENSAQCVRIANIKVSALASGSGEADLIELTEHATNLIPSANVMSAPGQGMKSYFVCNQTLRRFINKQYRTAGLGASLPTATVDGMMRKMLHDIPLLTVNQLINTEGTIS